MKIRHRKGFYEKHVKRPMDFVISLLALVILSPLILCIAVLVKVNLGSPILFMQERPGLNEKIFLMYKFRSMTDERDKKGRLLSDEKRLTKFGMFLRASSLDELPELINIVKGEMSLIGPRPQLVKDMVFMTQEHRKRHLVRPGLSGLAQVNGRNNISWDKKLKYDLKYVNNITFVSDCKIIINTVHKVLTRKGINTDGMQSSEDYGDYLFNNNKVGIEIYNEKQKEAIILLKRTKENGIIDNSCI